MAVLESGPSYEDDRTVLRVEVFDSFEEPSFEELEAIEADEVGELDVDPVSMMASYVKGLRGNTFTTNDVARFRPASSAPERSSFMKKVIRALESDEETAPRLRAEGNTSGRKYWLASLFSAEAAAEGPAWFEENAHVELEELNITKASELTAVRKLLRELHSLHEDEISDINGIAIEDIFKACNRSIMAFNAKIIDQQNARLGRGAHDVRWKHIRAEYEEDSTISGFKALANCRGVDPKVFFPSDGWGVERAQAVCQDCSVRTECLEYALENHERYGVWGGTSEGERRRIIKQRVLAAKDDQQAAGA